jgi:hypothetical protein
MQGALSGRLTFASDVANGQKAGYGQITASDNDFLSDNGLFDQAREIGFCVGNDEDCGPYMNLSSTSDRKSDSSLRRLRPHAAGRLRTTKSV